MSKNFSDYVYKNINLGEKFLWFIDVILDKAGGEQQRNYSKKMSVLEKIFFLTFYFYINTPFLSFSDWHSYFLTEYRYTGIEPVKPLLRFQQKYGKYKIDFAIIRKYCKIAIEVDGFKFHDRDRNQFDYERERQNFLTSNNWTIFRFTWKAITERFDDVYYQIMSAIETRQKQFYGEIIEK